MCESRGTFFLQFVDSHGRLAALYRTSSHCCSPFFHAQPAQFLSRADFSPRIWNMRTVPTINYPPNCPGSRQKDLYIVIYEISSSSRVAYATEVRGGGDCEQTILGYTQNALFIPLVASLSPSTCCFPNINRKRCARGWLGSRPNL